MSTETETRIEFGFDPGENSHREHGVPGSGVVGGEQRAGRLQDGLGLLRTQLLVLPGPDEQPQRLDARVQVARGDAARLPRRLLRQRPQAPRQIPTVARRRVGTQSVQLHETYRNTCSGNYDA